jgi:FKBP-type peptidyl-prolyl cis-trans isomerase
MDKPRRLRITKVTRVVDLKTGTGPQVKAGDAVRVHYVGRLADGTTFDSSKGRAQPFEFFVGRGVVIKGWDVGLVGMRAGGVRRLVIPPNEAYGRGGAPPAVPPNATLFFEVELLQIK